ncbi:MAG: sugar ABC transporter substrate-binding protein [Oscillospiraceae bacterium]
MKKILSVLLILAMLISVAGCSSAPAESKAESKKDDTVSVADTTVDKEKPTNTAPLKLVWNSDGANKDQLDAALAKFTENTGIAVEYIFLPLSWGEYFTKIQTMVAGGDAPDAATIAIEGVQLFNKLGLTKPLNEYIDSHPEVKADLESGDVPDTLIKAMSVGDQILAIPSGWNNSCVHFNTKLLAEAGLEVPPEKWGKEELLDYCKKLTKDKEDGTKQYGMYIPNSYFEMEGWLFNNGGGIMNDEFNKCTLNEPAAVEIFQLFQDMIFKYGYAPIPEPNVSNTQLMIDGNVAMYSAGRWPCSSYNDNNFSDVAIQYYPTFKQNVPVYGVDGLVVINGTERYEEASELAVYAASAEYEDIFLTAGSIPSRKSVADVAVPKLGYPKNNEIYYKSQEIGKPVHSPSNYAEVQVVFDRAKSEIFVNQANVQETLDAAAAEIDALLTK